MRNQNYIPFHLPAERRERPPSVRSHRLIQWLLKNLGIRANPQNERAPPSGFSGLRRTRSTLDQEDDASRKKRNEIKLERKIEEKMKLKEIILSLVGKKPTRYARETMELFADKKVPIDKLDFSGSNLREAQLSEISLAECNLDDVDLEGADLRKANFIRTTLTGADLKHADLSGAKLKSVSLHDADIRSANFQDAQFDSVDWEGAVGNEKTILPFPLSEAPQKGIWIEKERYVPIAKGL